MLSVGSGYSINLIKLYYLLAVLGMLGLYVVMFFVVYPHLYPNVKHDSSYGVLMIWFAIGPIFLVSVTLATVVVNAGFLLTSTILSTVVLIHLSSLVFFVLLLSDYMFVSNREFSYWDHPSNDPLFCCVYWQTNPGCFNAGPCENVNVDLYNLPIGNSGENITIFKKDLKLNPTFKISVIVTGVIFLLQSTIFYLFLSYFRNLNILTVFKKVPVKYYENKSKPRSDILKDYSMDKPKTDTVVGLRDYRVIGSKQSNPKRIVYEKIDVKGKIKDRFDTLKNKVGRSFDYIKKNEKISKGIGFIIICYAKMKKCLHRMYKGLRNYLSIIFGEDTVDEFNYENEKYNYENTLNNFNTSDKSPTKKRKLKSNVIENSSDDTSDIKYQMNLKYYQ